MARPRIAVIPGDGIGREVIAASVSAGLLTDEPFGWREAVGCVLILSAGLVEALPELRNRR